MDSQLYILRNANVVTMEEDRVLSGTDVFVANGKIYRIRKRIDVSDVPQIDCTGKYIMPGLFDNHIHMDASDITDMLIANGITTARNMWGMPETQQWRREIDAGTRPGPKIYSTGPLTDGVTYWEGSKIVKTPEEAHQAVIDCIRDGYEWVKTYPSIPREAFFELMRTANELGIKVVGHGNWNVSFQELADSGYFALEHIGCLPDTRHEEEIVMLAEAGLWSTPTVVVAKTIEDYVHLNLDLSLTPNYERMNPYWHENWKQVTDWRKSLHRYDDYDFGELLERERVFMKHSDRILLGTDVPNPGVTGGYSIFEELENLVRCFGMSPYQAFRCGSVNGAVHMGIADHVGVLKEGYDADLLILPRNPLENVSYAADFERVVKGGRIYDKQWCENLLEVVRNRERKDIVALL